jgi:hypothetical protein
MEWQVCLKSAQKKWLQKYGAEQSWDGSVSSSYSAFLGHLTKGKAATRWLPSPFWL